MSGMTEVKVSDLTGHALDYAVDIAISGVKPTAKHAFAWQYQNEARKDYSTCWIDGGPLFANSGIDVIRTGHFNRYEDPMPAWSSVADWSGSEATEFGVGGDTFLIAACRAFVTEKLGETITLPSRLFQ